MSAHLFFKMRTLVCFSSHTEPCITINAAHTVKTQKYHGHEWLRNVAVELGNKDSRLDDVKEMFEGMSIATNNSPDID